MLFKNLQAKLFACIADLLFYFALAFIKLRATLWFSLWDLIISATTDLLWTDTVTISVGVIHESTYSINNQTTLLIGSCPL